MSANCGILSCCQGEVKLPPKRIPKEAPRLFLNLLNSEPVLTRLVRAVSPPTLHFTSTHVRTPTPSPSSTPIHKHLPVALSKLSKPERRVGVGGELGPDFSAAEEPEGPMGYSGYQPPILQY